MEMEKGQGAPATAKGYILCNGHNDSTETTSANGTLATDKLLEYPLEARTNDVEKAQEKHHDVEVEVDEEEEVKRESWGRKTEYVLSMIGFCVGLGNVWRFPYVCIRNGGGAFLIPFFVCLVFVGMPLYILEVCLGQFTSRGPFHVWNISRLFKGIGLATVILCSLCYWYYNMILAWSLIYIVNSFKSPLPWSVCGQEWNTVNCRTRELKGISNENSSLANDTLTSLWSQMSNYSLEMRNSTALAFGGDLLQSGNVTVTKENITFSTVEFWKYNVLEISSGFHDMGGLPWHTSLALLAVNVIVLIGIVKGIQSSGKVVYVTATLPYLLLTVLLVRGATLPGARDGVLFYLRPDFEKLIQVQTWIEAAVQVFYSLGPTWGGLIAMASYNKFNNKKCIRDSIILTFVCEGTSIFGGFAIFTILGHMAYTAGVPVETFSNKGPSLAFIVYPEGISYLPLPQVWAVLFFVMLLSLGLDTQFCMSECVLTSIVDQWPRVMTKWRSVLSTVFIGVFFCLSLPFASRGGMYVFQLVDWYVATFAVLGQAVLENIVVGWIYGADNFCRDIEMMIGRKPCFLHSILWKYVSPALLSAMLVCTLIAYSPPIYEDYVYGPDGIAFGWFVATTGFTSIPLTAVWVLWKAEGSLRQRIKSSCNPDPSFGPSEPKLRALYWESMQDSSLCDMGMPTWRKGKP